MSKKVVIITLLLLAGAFRAMAQEDESTEDDLFHKTIDSAMAISPLYLPTSYTDLGITFFKPIDYTTIDTTIDLIAQHDPMEQTQNICQTLGISGHAHKFINFTYHKEPGFALFSYPYPLYFKEQNDLKYYDLKTVYTNIGFTYSVLPQQYMVTATHTQNIRDKVRYAVNLRGFSSNGYYTNQKTSNIVADALIHYEIPSQIYGFKASYIVNYFNLEENGGLLNMRAFVEQDSTMEDTRAYNMKLYSASSKLLTHDLLFQQYVNIISKNKRKGKDNYWGTFQHTFQFKQQSINYFDYNLDTLYYGNIFFYSSDTTRDSTHFYTLSNTLQWSTFKPLKKDANERYFFHFTGGITYEFTRYAAANYTGHALIPFAQVHARLFSVMDIHGKLFYTLGGYQNNDLNANATVSWAISRKHRHFLGADIDYYFRMPDYTYTYFFSNGKFWRNDWKKQNVLRFSAFWEREGYKAEFNYFMLHNYVIIDSTWTPKAIDKYINIIQLHLYAPVYIKGFGAKVNIYMQYSNNKAVQVPIFAGKLDAFYRLNIFKNKAKLQFGFALAYNTNYYADGYCPMLHSFYTQDNVKVGNYLYFDPHIAIQVQRIALYFKVTHVLCGAMRYGFFTTPDYPMENRQFQLGITWRFFD